MRLPGSGAIVCYITRPRLPRIVPRERDDPEAVRQPDAVGQVVRGRLHVERAADHRREQRHGDHAPEQRLGQAEHSSWRHLDRSHLNGRQGAAVTPPAAPPSHADG
jgi:hypothetical protein